MESCTNEPILDNFQGVENVQFLEQQQIHRAQESTFDSTVHDEEEKYHPVPPTTPQTTVSQAPRPPSPFF
jgi:hypothetical protein